MTKDFEFVSAIVDGNDWETLKQQSANIRAMMQTQTATAMTDEQNVDIMSLLDLVDTVAHLVDTLYGDDDKAEEGGSG